MRTFLIATAAYSISGLGIMLMIAIVQVLIFGPGTEHDFSAGALWSYITFVHVFPWIDRGLP